MARANGSRAQYALAYESTYGTAPGSGFIQMPFVSEDLSAEQGLGESDILGYGRDPQAPVRDAVNVAGTIDVPVDQVAIGYWLKALLGAPTTAGLVAATGSILFTALPAVNSTVTINGTIFTFVASGATGNQVNIGVSITATANNLQTVLNASIVAGVALATYTSPSTSLLVAFDTVGLAGNAFTLAASGPSNGVVSAATLTGGANSHTFISGAATLPSVSIEKGSPDVPYFEMFTGIVANSMKFDLKRTGLLTATVAVVGQGSTPATATAAGTPTALTIARFGTFAGAIKRNGAALGAIVSADMEYSNNVDAVEVIRADGKIDGVDPTVASLKGALTARFADTALLDQAVAGTDCSLEFSWTASASQSLTLTAHSAWLPRPKRSVDGPAGVQVSFDWMGAKAVSPARLFTAVLVNQIAAY